MYIYTLIFSTKQVVVLKITSTNSNSWDLFYERMFTRCTWHWNWMNKIYKILKYLLPVIKSHYTLWKNMTKIGKTVVNSIHYQFCRYSHPFLISMKRLVISFEIISRSVSALEFLGGTGKIDAMQYHIWRC